MTEPAPMPLPAPMADWEAFYASYRKPGYVPGFEITSKLGGGMSGLVFKATKQSIGRDYAIKFLRVEDESVRRAVLLELEQVRFFAQVDHPNLVSIEDRGEVDGIPFLVMTYAGSETLRDRLPGRPEDRDELLLLLLQACRGVAALHDRSLVHFDLKPANVFLKGNVARVGDYGLSKLVTHSRGSLSMGRGTPYYMAPEMLQRRGDHRSDVYSLGVMLYEVLTGEVPFRGDSEWEVLRRHETARIEFPPHVAPRERAVIERAMAKRPEQRFQSVHDLVLALGAPSGAGSASLGETRARSAPAGRPAAAAAATASEGGGSPAPSAADPYRHFRDASRNAYAHASGVARRAMAEARQHARKAMHEMQRSVREAMQRGHGKMRRRGEAWRRLLSRRRTQRRQRREERRARRGSQWVPIGIVALLLFVILPWSRRHRAPVEQPGIAIATVDASAPVVVRVPDRYRAAVSDREPSWVAEADANRELAEALLHSHQAVFLAAAPVEFERRLVEHELPTFAPARAGATRQTKRSIARLAERLVSTRAYDEAIAEELGKHGRQALFHCAELLEQRGRADRRAAENLDRFLCEATGFAGFAYCRDDVPEPSRQRADANLGRLWRWYLNEFAQTERAWQIYRRLAR